jgi:spore coat polysaccharide biosynthesis protein SpsF
MGSTRLPGKVLKTIKGKTLLEYHLERLEKTGLPVVVATSELGQDDPIVELCDRLGVSVWRGDEQDVLSRYAEAAQEYGFDPVIRVTSDCPLIDPSLLMQGLKKYEANNYEYLEAVAESGIPHGLDFQIVSYSKLKEADLQATEVYKREHVMPYVSKQSGISRGQINSENNYRWIRITVDQPEDFQLITILIEQHQADELDWRGIVDIIESQPELLNVNKKWNEYYEMAP